MENTKKSKKELNFWWGNVYIAVNILLGIAYAATLIYLTFKGELMKILSAGSGLIVNTAGIIIFFGTSVGIIIGLLKRKKWGLYFLYILLGSKILEAIYGLIKGTTDLKLGIFGLVVFYFIIEYFYKRRSWFK